MVIAGLAKVKKNPDIDSYRAEPEDIFDFSEHERETGDP